MLRSKTKTNLYPLELVMSKELVHIREGWNKIAYCGEQLVKSTFDPFLFINNYNPHRDLYCVYRVLTVGTSYPVYEQVEIRINPMLCDHCLSGFGLLLLRDLGEKQLLI